MTALGNHLNQRQSHPRRSRCRSWGCGENKTGEKKNGDEEKQSSPTMLFLVAIFFARFVFSAPPRSAPGSPRMRQSIMWLISVYIYGMHVMESKFPHKRASNFVFILRSETFGFFQCEASAVSSPKPAKKGRILGNACYHGNSSV